MVPLSMIALALKQNRGHLIEVVLYPLVSSRFCGAGFSFVPRFELLIRAFFEARPSASVVCARFSAAETVEFATALVTAKPKVPALCCVTVDRIPKVLFGRPRFFVFCSQPHCLRVIVDSGTTQSAAMDHVVCGQCDRG